MTANPACYICKNQFEKSYWSNPREYGEIFLYQIGDLSSEENYAYCQHIQTCYEISCIVSGKGFYSTNDKALPVKAGSIYLNIPGDRHEWRADSADPFRFFYLGFGFNPGSDDNSMFSSIQHKFNLINHPVISDNMGIRQSFRGAFNYLLNDCDCSNTLITTYLYQIIALTYRGFFDVQCPNYSITCKSEGNCREAVNEVKKYIDGNLCSINDLSEIADKLGYSYSYLSHVFTKETGVSIQQYYGGKRLEKAFELLQNESLSITQISNILNYDSIHTFSRAFTRVTGISPMEYRICRNINLRR